MKTIPIPCSKGQNHPGAYRFQHRPAFTLVEMLVAISIMAVLAALALNGFKMARAQAQRAECSSQLRQIYQALCLYRAENDDYYLPETPYTPQGGNGNWLNWFSPPSPLMQYIGGSNSLQKITVCPANRTPEANSLPSYLRNPYGYPYTVNYNIMPNPATNGWIKGLAISRPSATLLMADSTAGLTTWGPGIFDVTSSTFRRLGAPHGQKANILWCDGHVSLEEPGGISNINLYR